MTFEDWLAKAPNRRGTGKISKSTAKKYSSGLRITSDEMYAAGVIKKRLELMTVDELDDAIMAIMKDSNFLAKDARGDKMYSNSLKRYRDFMYEINGLNITRRII